MGMFLKLLLGSFFSFPPMFRIELIIPIQNISVQFELVIDP